MPVSAKKQSLRATGCAALQQQKVLRPRFGDMRELLLPHVLFLGAILFFTDAGMGRPAESVGGGPAG